MLVFVSTFRKRSHLAMIFQKLLMMLLIGILGLPSSSGNVVKDNENAVSNIVSSVWKIFGLEPEVTMNLNAMVKHYGYPFEVHDVITEDGYILTNHRIPHGRNGQTADANKHPVILIHGAYVSSELWLANVPDKNAAFILADAGFDVWMLNCRGNMHSRKHQTLKVSDAAFWDFSADEYGYYDLASFIDYVINKTGKKQVYIISHSLGGSTPFELLADKPAYNQKIKKIYALSPASIQAELKGILPTILKQQILYPILKLVKNIGVQEVGSTMWIPNWLLGFLVKYFEPVVKYIVFQLVGPGYESWNATRVPFNVVRGKGSFPMNIALHALQRYHSREFQHFDWGEAKNIIKYGQPSPPKYNLSNVNVPTQLFYSTNDYLVPEGDVKFFQINLRNVTAMSLAGYNWNHISYFWATDAGTFYNNIRADIIRDNV